MAKIILTIEDGPGGKVRVTSNPSFETLMKKHRSGHELTSADGYALRAINAIMAESKSKEPTKILIPRLGQ